MSSLEMSDDSKKAIRSYLESKDEDGNGVINKYEFEECLLSMGCAATPEDIKFLMRRFDTNNDGRLNIDEIMENLDVINMHSVHGDDLMEAFKKFDKKGDGYISGYELKQILRAPGDNQMDKEEAEELVKELLEKYDENRDMKFSYSEFVRMFADGNPLEQST